MEAMPRCIGIILTVMELKFLFTPSLLVQTFKWWDVLIFREILLTSSIRNVWRTVRRICIFISGLKELNTCIIFLKNFKNMHQRVLIRSRFLLNKALYLLLIVAFIHMSINKQNSIHRLQLQVLDLNLPWN